MDLQALIDKINKLEYHQSLLLKMTTSTTEAFYKLIIEKSLSQEEVQKFYKNCDNLSIVYEEQKAEGFVYYHPLYKKFITDLHPKLSAEEVIIACLSQGLYVPLMTEFKKYLSLSK